MSMLFGIPAPAHSHPFFFLQVYHGSEVLSIYHDLSNDTSASATLISNVMLDYWISFATSLDPNDGYGNKRILFPILLYFIYRNQLRVSSLGPIWPQYTTENQV